MRKNKRLDPALLNELIDGLIAQAGSDDEDRSSTALTPGSPTDSIARDDKSPYTV